MSDNVIGYIVVTHYSPDRHFNMLSPGVLFDDIEDARDAVRGMQAHAGAEDGDLSYTVHPVLAEVTE